MSTRNIKKLLAELLVIGVGFCCLSYIIYYKNKPTSTEEIADALIEYCGGLDASLIEAAGVNDTILTKHLIARGAKIEGTNDSWAPETPLLRACYNGSADTAAILLENGANIEVRDELGKTPLIVACFSYINGSEEGTNKSAAIIDLLLKFHADIDNCDREGLSALAWAAKKGYLNLVKLLVKRGASVNSPDIFQTTPLIWACWEGNWDVADYLIQKGANINAKNRSGICPLKASIIRGNTNFARKLIKLGADS